jgi:hypothetical protein
MTRAFQEVVRRHEVRCGPSFAVQDGQPIQVDPRRRRQRAMTLVDPGALGPRCA